MKRKQIFVLLGSAVLCIAGLLALYAFSPLSKEIYRASFDRKIERNVLKEKAVMDIEYNSFYIAGYDKDKIFFGNSTAPFHLLITNTTLTDSQHVMLKVGLDSIMEPRRFKLAVEPPYFYLSHGVMPKLLRGKIGEWNATQFLSDSRDYFVESVPMGPKSLALRAYSISKKGYELAKKSSEKSFRFNYDLLNKQIDGLFCVDGQLHYSRELNKLVYLHYYRNEFLVADTNLNLSYRGHTIDTFRRAMIKVSKIGNKEESMLSAPPMQINGKSCVFDKYLFVQSSLLANNETVEDFMNGSIIDVYELIEGKYLNSFYIPNYNHERPMDFQVSNNSLHVIFDHFIVQYEIIHDIFKKHDNDKINKEMSLK